MASDTTPQPPLDSRAAQAERVADCLEQRPGSTAKEIDADADTGCVTKVLSSMPGLGYGIGKAWRVVACDSGNHTRRVRTYTLTHRPTVTQSDLFTAS